MSQQPRSIIDPVDIRNPIPNELEYLDIFDFFNYPRLPTHFGNVPYASNAMQNAETPAPVTDFAMPNAALDWLVFEPPHD